jgi:NAD(P)-dependent dehydrogenase (short-subunit alcohol dehydrogenase family)
MTNLRNPLEAGPKPPFPEQQLERPELESEMEPKPDYGADSYRGDDRLLDRVALITGGDSGIGRAVALAFAREGADIVVSYLEADEDAEETVRIVEGEGRRATAARGDVGDAEWCRRLVEHTIAEHGRLDLVVLNAATQTVHESITDIPHDEIETVFRTNILSFFWLAQAAIPHLRPGSSIITTTSIQAFQPSPSLIHYATTKGAIVTFTKALAQELIEKGIRVNGVAPGPVWTPLIPMSVPSPEDAAEFGADNPMKRPAQPAELAPAYVFLASDEARFVVGEVIGVTGGRLTPA